MSMNPTIQRYHHQSSVIGNILCPSNGIRDDLKRRGIAPHDHMKDNRRHIAELERQKHEEKVEEEIRKSAPEFKMQQFETVGPRALKKTEEVCSDPNGKHTNFLRAKTGFVSVSGKSYEEDEYDREVKKLPRRSALPPEALGNVNPLEQGPTNISSPKVNYVAQNKSKATKRQVTMTKNEIEQQKRQEVLNKTHKPGEVPTYIQKRQQELENEKERLKKEKEEKAKMSKVPPNTRLVGDEERKELLAGFKESLKIEIKRLNSFPVCGDSNSLVRAKAECERKIEQLEKTIMEFERKGDLYIALD